ncbi:MAG TPA: SpoIIE family protein phosphatase [Actinomycetes bacterium]|nr:SpoIIE family protein phosphatase [Actinomycetes bacterium]
MTLPPAEPSVAAARGMVAAALAGWAAEELTDDATLLVSELATNAVLHAGTDFEVAAQLLGDAVEVSVTDHHPTRTLPQPAVTVDEELEGGRGLFLTSSLAQMWGVDYTSTSKRVWFRLALPVGAVPAPRTRAPTVEDADLVAGVGTVRLDPHGVVSWADDAAAGLLGRPSGDELVGRRWLSLCEPDEVATVVAASASPRWQGSYPVLLPDGGTRRVQVRHVRTTTGPDGLPGTVVVLVDHRLRALLADVPGGSRPTGPASSALPAGPFALSPESLVRLELGALLQRTAGWARDALGGDGAYALLVSGDDDALEARALVGLPPPGPLVPDGAAHGVAARVARDLMPVVHDDLGDTYDADPDFRSGTEGWLRAAGVRSLVAVPVLAEGRSIGSIGVTSHQPSAFGSEAGATLQRAVDAVALAVQSARVTEIERRRHGWLGFLAEAGDLLAGTLDPEMALALVAQLVTPRLGPWSAVHLVDESGRSTLATVWHEDEERLADLRAYLDAVLPPEPPVRGSARWLPRPVAGLTAGAAAIAAAGGQVAPLVARGRTLGTLAVGQPESTREMHLLGDLAPRAALALDNALLYAERTAASRALQGSLLPPELPVLPGVDVGVVYEASGRGNEVGGDFYDVFALDPAGTVAGGRFAFAIGDVCGKGPEAAAVTGLARTALRLLGRRGDDIPQVLAELNDAVLAEGSRARFVTLVYGEATPRPDGSLDVRFASAGHPAPVVLRVDGTTTAVGRAGDLLGVFAKAETVVDTLRLGPGDTLVCFTDGVTERRDSSTTGRMLGEDGVLAVLAGASDLDATGVARRLGRAVADFAATAARDDVAVLALRAVRPRPRAG